MPSNHHPRATASLAKDEERIWGFLEEDCKPRRTPELRPTFLIKYKKSNNKYEKDKTLSIKTCDGAFKCVGT